MSRLPISICYGLEAAASRIVLVRAQRKGRSCSAESFTASMPPGDAPFLARMRKELESGQAVVVSALPVLDTFIRRLTAPFASARKAQKILPSLLDVQIPVPLEKCISQYMGLHAVAGGKISALGIAARKDDVRAHVARLSSFGMEPVVIDHEAVALWSASLRDVPAAGDERRIILHVAESHTAVMLGSGHALATAHGFRAGLDAVLGDSAESSAFWSRLEQVLRSQGMDPATSPARIALTGAGATKPNLESVVRTRLRLPETVVFIAHKDPASFLAKAVAERALLGDESPCNFRQDDLAHPWIAVQDVGARRHVAIAAIAAGLVLIAASFGWTVWMKSRIDELQARVTTLATSLAGDTRIPKGQEVLVAQRAITERAANLSPLSAHLSGARSSLLGIIFQAALANAVTFDQMTLRRSDLSLSGEAGSWDACEAIATALRGTGWKPMLERTGDPASERISFSIKATP